MGDGVNTTEKPKQVEAQETALVKEETGLALPHNVILAPSEWQWGWNQIQNRTEDPTLIETHSLAAFEELALTLGYQRDEVRVVVQDIPVRELSLHTMFLCYA